MLKQSLLVGLVFAFVATGCAGVSSSTKGSSASTSTAPFVGGAPLDVFAEPPQPKPPEVRKLAIERAYAPVPAVIGQQPRPLPPSPRS